MTEPSRGPKLLVSLVHPSVLRERRESKILTEVLASLNLAYRGLFLAGNLNFQRSGKTLPITIATASSSALQKVKT